MDPLNQHPSHPLPSTSRNLYITMQQPLLPNQQPSHPLPVTTMQQPPQGFYGGSSLTGPCCPGRLLHQGMMAPRTQHVQQQQYLPPRPGPNRRANKRRHKAGSQKLIQSKHESSGTVSNDRSTGVDPGMSRNNPSNNPGRGKV